MREPAKTPQAAQTRYVRIIQRTLSCLTDAIWVVGQTPGADDRSLLLSQTPIRLKRKSGAPLLLDASQRFELIPDPRYEGEWKSHTLAYVYEVKVEGEGEPDLLGWHWHPPTTPDRDYPHTHVRVEYPNLGSKSLPKLHLPSGRVSFEEVVRFLIDELGVQPARDDWEEVVGESEARFRAFRMWA